VENKKLNPKNRKTQSREEGPVDHLIAESMEVSEAFKIVSGSCDREPS
jgi:hypothetical protein